MPSGFFLGGAAEGAMGAQKMALAERAQTEETEFRRGGLQLQERQFANTMSQQQQAQADAHIAQTMGVVSETIKNAVAVGTPPDKIMQAVGPLVQSAQAIASRVGRDPNALVAQVQAEIARPGAVQAAEVGGTAAGRGAVARTAATQQVPLPAGPGQPGAAAPGGPPPARIEDVNPFEKETDRVTAENSLRDDFVKNSKEFVTIRDFYDRMKSASTTGAGDISLVFSFMKMLDPGSTVREGEYATASNSGGVPSTIQAMYNKLVGGGVLADPQRKQIKDEGATIWGSALNRHSSQVTQFTKIAKGQGLRPQHVVIDYTAGSEGSAIPPPPAGFTILGR